MKLSRVVLRWEIYVEKPCVPERQTAIVVKLQTLLLLITVGGDVDTRLGIRTGSSFLNLLKISTQAVRALSEGAEGGGLQLRNKSNQGTSAKMS